MREIIDTMHAIYNAASDKLKEHLINSVKSLREELIQHDAKEQYKEIKERVEEELSQFSPDTYFNGYAQISLKNVKVEDLKTIRNFMARTHTLWGWSISGFISSDRMEYSCSIPLRKTFDLIYFETLFPNLASRESLITYISINVPDTCEIVEESRLVTDYKVVGICADMAETLRKD